jgi:hypothetical protein
MRRHRSTIIRRDHAVLKEYRGLSAMYKGKKDGVLPCVLAVARYIGRFYGNALVTYILCCHHRALHTKEDTAGRRLVLVCRPSGRRFAGRRIVLAFSRIDVVQTRSSCQCGED